ncbi:MAG TPA: phosphodiester glycosidase family protein [Gaiellaceae bacterium]|nr:phosphodiester glycosidase family protein [Gaiellaceae bacterium]
MLRKAVFLAAALAAAFPTAASAIHLAPGVVYKRQVRTIGGARVVVHVLKAPRPGGLYDLRPVLSNGTVTGRETVSSMQRRLSHRATVSGVNGDMFNWQSGRPSGIFLRHGELATRASPDRSSLGIGLDGLLRTDVIRYRGTWQFGSNRLRVLREFNHPLEAANGVALFSPTWGPRTPRLSHGREVVLSRVGRVGPNKELSGKVVAHRRRTGRSIPAGGAVLQAAGDRRRVLFDEAELGHWVKLNVALTPWWDGVKDAIGGGPRLVSGGVPVFQAGEAFLSSQLLPRNPRTAVGQLRSGRVILVAIDGRVSWSAGVTNTQLARLMVKLGAVTAMALDAGGSTTMAFGGHVLNHPSDGRERAVADALMVFYFGIYAPRPRLSLYSPNGDGVADVQRLSAKVVRRSRVKRQLVRASNGHVLWSSTGTKPAGTLVRTLTRRLADGKWRWVVSAVDRKGRASRMSRSFKVNSTLGFLRLSKDVLRPRRRGGRLGISFRLERAADVRVTVVRSGGGVVRHLAATHMGRGRVALAWNVRNDRGRIVRDGRYLVRVRAANEVGAVALKAAVRVRRRF